MHKIPINEAPDSFSFRLSVAPPPPTRTSTHMHTQVQTLQTATLAKFILVSLFSTIRVCLSLRVAVKYSGESVHRSQSSAFVRAPPPRLSGSQVD